MAFFEYGLKFVNYTELNDTESQNILNIRNSEEIRKWMLNDDIILFESHKNFIEKLKKDETKQYFAIYKDDILIGSTSLSKIIKNESAESGFYSNPKYFKTIYGLLVYYYGLSFMIKQFNLKRVNAGFFMDNANVVTINLAMNFEIEKQYLLNDRQYADIYINTENWIFDLPIKDVINKIIRYKQNNQK
jgi:UDP-4-amino-4,6-dideoxy-N-acetyl-beta-L-altrosamine N-acetyltransferase